jgi:peptide/nickel transport system ATP-binding protein
MALLDVRNLSVHYRVRGGQSCALREVSFSIQPGQVLAVVGESGCGKTTLALALMGLLPPTAGVSGSVMFDGRELAGLDEHAWERVRGREMAMVFQGAMNAWNPVYSVGDQILEAIQAHESNLRLSEARTRVAGLFTSVGLAPDRMDSFPHEYSGGMKQRAVIAMALACGPKLVIADEPTTALDVIVQDRIMRELRRIQRERQLGMLYISHDMAVVAELADVVAVMYAGSIVEIGPAFEVFTRPVHPYTSALLGAAPSLHGPRRQPRGLAGAPPSLVDGPPGCRFHPRCTRADGTCRTTEPSPVNHRDLLVAACWHPLPASGSANASAEARAAGPACVSPESIVEVAHADRHFRVRRGLFIRHSQNVVRAVDDATFEIGRGEALGLVGESGSGKTTIGRMLVQLDQPTNGRIRVRFGDHLELIAGVDRRTFRRNVQMIFQDPYESLNPRMRIGEIVAEPLEVLALEPATTRSSRVDRMLERVGLSPAATFAGRYPHELSGGQRQRVAIARAMVVEPRFVVADEPTSMLDVSVGAGIMELMLGLKHEFGVSYLYITHDLSVARVVCDRIAVIYRGRIVEIGEVELVLQRPLHPYTQALVVSVPVPDPSYRRPDPWLKSEAAGPSAAADACRFLGRCPAAIAVCGDQPHPLLAMSQTPRHLVACHVARSGVADALVRV